MHFQKLIFGSQVYYGFSNLIQTRYTPSVSIKIILLISKFEIERTSCVESAHIISSQFIKPDPNSLFFLSTFFSVPWNRTKHWNPTSMHALNSRLVDSPKLLDAPPSAASRINHHPRSINFQSRWNQEVAHLFAKVIDWDQRFLEWGRKVLYGEQTPHDHA